MKKYTLFLILLIVIAGSATTAQASINLPASGNNNLTDFDYETSFPANTTAGTFTKIINFPESKYGDGITKYLSFDLATAGSDKIQYAFYNWDTRSYELSSEYDYTFSTTDAIISTALSENHYPIRMKIISVQSGNPSYHAWAYDVHLTASSYNYTIVHSNITTENTTSNPPYDAFDRDSSVENSSTTSVDISTEYYETYDEGNQQYLVTYLDISSIEDVYSRINITLELPEMGSSGGFYPLNTALYNYDTEEYDNFVFTPMSFDYAGQTYTIDTSNNNFFNIGNNYKNGFYIYNSEVTEDYLSNGIMRVKLYTNRDTSTPFAGFKPAPILLDEMYIEMDQFQPLPPSNLSNINNDYSVILQDTNPGITFSEGHDIHGQDITTYVYFGTSESNMLLDGTTTGESHTFGNNITINQGYDYFYKLRSYNEISFSDFSETNSFHVNAKPDVSGVSISPALPTVLDNLNVSYSSITDAEGDNTTLYYKWYKDGVFQPTLSGDVVILADNTSSGEIWQAGIIANDGYQNSSEVRSQSVEIGSTNSAPSISSVTANFYYAKKNVVLTFQASGATDSDDDYFWLEVGNSSGARDIVTSDPTKSSSINVSFSMPFDDGYEHDFYVRVNDSSLTSQEFVVSVLSDTRNPVYQSSSVSSTTGYAGNTIAVYVNCYSDNATITDVVMSIDRPDTVTQTLEMTQGSSNTWYYNYGYTSDVGTYSINYFNITDISDTTIQVEPSLSFVLSTALSSGGGGGGSDSDSTTIITTNETIGDLALSPEILDNYALYTGTGANQTFDYTFIANREITSCELTGDRATCEIEEGYIVKVYLPVSADNLSPYEGTLTVKDSNGYVATSSIVIRVNELYSISNIFVVLVVLFLFLLWASTKN